MVLGGWSAKLLADVTSLNVADVLKQHGPQTAASLVDNYGVRALPSALERALRACAAMGIFTEEASGAFGPTALSEALVTDSPGSVKRLVECFGHSSFYKVFAELPAAIRTGAKQARTALGAEWWDYLNAHPDELELFGDAMKANSASEMQAVLDRCDLSNASKVVDVGGGLGHLVIALLGKYPKLQGVLLDLPALIPVAKERLPVKDPAVAARLEYVGASMFDSVPPADTYIMKHIIHDWDDEHCVKLLTNCRQSMVGNGRVIAVDTVLPPLGDTGMPTAKVTDIVMMVFIGGKERTLKQWEDLYHAAGLRIVSVTPAANDTMGNSIIEGVKR
jgi:hypothetical protein